MSETYPPDTEILNLRREQLDEWIDFTFLRHDPFAFQNGDFHEYRRQAARGLSVDANGIFCVGSGAVGWSFDPESMQEGRLRPFRPDPVEDRKASDFDIAFVSEIHFERAWRELREKEQNVFEPEIVSNMRSRDLNFQRRQLFNGAIVGDHLSLLSFNDDWLKVIGPLRDVAADARGHFEFEMNFFIYRDYWSVRNSVKRSISSCRQRRLLQDV